MTVVVGGSETGLMNSSLQYGVGQAIGNAVNDTAGGLYTNVANGNLVYTQKDSFLVSQGEDFGLVRTYNARARMNDASGLGDARWRLSTAVTLTEQAERGVSYYTVTWGDGSVFDYRWNSDANAYVSTDGAGAYEKLTIGTDGSASLVRADQSIWSFDGQGRLVSSVNTNGVLMGYGYDADGLKTITDDTGHVITFNYSNGLLSSVNDENNTRLVSYSYTAGLLTAVTDRRGDVTSYAYNTAGYLQSVALPNSYVDGAANVQVDLDRKIEFGYETVRWSAGIAGPSQVLTSIKQGDQTTTISYAFELGPQASGRGQLYNAGSATIIDYLGNTLNYHFDSRGNILRTVDQLGYETIYKYDSADNLLSVTDRNGWGVVHSDSDYYQQLRLELGYTKINLSGLQVGQLVADLSVAEINALQAAFTSHSTYDDRGNMLTSTDNAGNTTVYTYTLFNKLETVTTPATLAAPTGALTSFEYDSSTQNLQRLTDTAGDITDFAYDIFGNMARQIRYLDGTNAATATAQQQQITEYDYDQWGNNTQTRTLVQAADVANATPAEWITTSVTYDQFGNALSVIDGNGWGAAYSDATYYQDLRQSLGSAVLVQDLSLGDQTALLERFTSHYTFDGDNRLLTSTDALNRTTINVYDAVGNRIEISAGTQNITRVYDQHNRLVETLDAAVDVAQSRRTTMLYLGEVTAETDARGATTTYTYNARRELVEIKSPEVVAEDGLAPRQYTQTMAYDHEGNTISVTDGRDNVSHYVYDSNGLLWVERQADNHTLRYSYDANLNVLSVVAGMQLVDELKRQTTRFVYDEKDRVIEEIDSEGHSTHYDYDAIGNVTRITVADDKSAALADGNSTELEYDLTNRLVVERMAAVEDPLDATGTIRYTITHAFDASGNEVSTTDQNNEVTTFRYDSAGRNWQVLDAFGTVTTYSYDFDDNVTKIQITGVNAAEPAQVKTYRYDDFNQLVAETDGIGNALLLSDSDAVQKLRVELGYTKADGAGVQIAKLAADLTEAEKQAIQDLFSTRYSYDKVGNQLAFINKEGHATSFEYDALNRLVKQTNASTIAMYDAAYIGTAFNEQRYFYDGNDNRVAAVDERNNTTTYQYDVMNRATQTTVSTQAAGDFVVNLAYDDFGNLQTETVGQGSDVERVTDYEYDLRNQVSQVRQYGATPSEDRLTTYSYDNVGNRLTSTDALSNNSVAKLPTVTYSYDALNRVISTADARGQKIQFGYDGKGNLLRTIDPRGNILEYDFDAVDRLIRTVDAEGRETSYSYDVLNNEIRVVTGVGNTGTGSLGEAEVRYEYDAESNLQAVVYVNGNSEERLEYDYNRVANLTQSKDGEGNISNFAFDALNRLITATDALGAVTTYTYDPVGNRLSRTDPAAAGPDGVADVVRSTSWTWDEMNRQLTEVDAAGTETQYHYYVNGAIKNITQAANIVGQERIVAAYEYDAFGNVASEYDAANNLRQYEYDANNNLVTQTEVSAAGPAQNIISDYAYNSLNQLVRTNKHLANGDTLVNYVAYDKNGFQSLLIDANGAPTSYIRNNNGELILEFSASGDVVGYIYDDQGNVLEERRYQAKAAAVGLVDFASLPPGVDDGEFFTDQPPQFSTSAEDSVTTFAYDARNQLITKNDPAGSRSDYTYDAVGNLQSKTVTQAGSAVIYTTTYSYDVLNRLIRQEGQELEYQATTFDAAGNVIQIDDNGVATDYTYDALDRLRRESTADSSVTSYTYDVYGNMVESVDKLDNQLSYSYDVLNRLVLQVDAVGNRLVSSDEPLYKNLRLSLGIADASDPTIGKGFAALSGGDKQLLLDAYGNAYSYDRLGNLQSQTGPDGTVTYWFRDNAGRLSASLNDQGHLTTYAFDNAGNQIQQREYAGVYTKTEYLAGAHVASVNILTEYSYDALSRLDSAKGAGITTHYYYADIDPNKLTSTSTETAGGVVRGDGSQAYDKAGRIVTSINAVGDETRLTLNALGNITTKVEAWGAVDARTTTYIYDLGGARLRAEVSPAGKITVMEYDGGSERVTAIKIYAKQDADTLPIDVSTLAGVLTLSQQTALKQERWVYDGAGDLKYTISALELVTGYVWDNGVLQTETVYTAGAAEKLEGNAAYVFVGSDVYSTTNYAYDASNQLGVKTSGTGGVDPATLSSVSDATMRVISNYNAYTFVPPLIEGNQVQFTNDSYVLETWMVVGDLWLNVTALSMEELGQIANFSRITTIYSYDANGNLRETVGAYGTSDELVTSYLYDSLGRLLKEVVDPDGLNQVTRYFYDTHGNNIVIESANGLVTFNVFAVDSDQLQYSVAGSLQNGISLGDDGQTWARVNLELYFIPKIKSAHGGIRTDYTFDEFDTSLVTSETVRFFDNTGRVQTTSYTYDAMGRQDSFTDAEGYTTSFEYDAFDNVVYTQTGLFLGDAADPRFALASPQETHFHYDQANNLILTVDGTGSATSAKYDVVGNRIEYVTGIANQISAKGPVSSRPGLLLTTYSDWFADGSLKEERTSAGAKITYTVDLFGRQTKIESLQSTGSSGDVVTTVQFSYDTAGNITQRVDMGVTTDYTYDEFGRVLSTKIPHDFNAEGWGSARQEIVTTTLVYDKTGNLLSTDGGVSLYEDQPVVTAYQYDAMGNLIQVDHRNGSSSHYYYNEFDQLTAEVEQLGGLTSYQRDAFGNAVLTRAFATPVSNAQLYTFTTPASSSLDRLTLRTFDANNQLSTETVGSGLIQTYTYSGVGQLVAQSTTYLSVVEAIAAGLVTNAGLITDTEDQAARTQYWSYDAAGRLERYIGAEDIQESYTYDAAGNQISARVKYKDDYNFKLLHQYSYSVNGSPRPYADAGTLTTYAYYTTGLLRSETTGRNQQTLEYDFAGNITKRIDANNRATIFAYDVRNQLVKTTDAIGNFVEYGYDVSGNLVSQKNARGFVTSYWYDQNDRLLRQINPAIQTYSMATGIQTFDKTMVSANAAERGFVEYTYDLDGNQTDARDVRGFTTRYWFDAVGRVSAELSASGVLRTYSYNIFGDVEVVNTDTTFHQSGWLDSVAPAIVNGVEVLNSYDILGRIIKTTYPVADFTTVTVAGSASTSVTVAAAALETNSYNIWGDLVQTVDREDQRATFYYDKMGRVEAQLDFSGDMTAFEYDSQSNIVVQYEERRPGQLSASSRGAGSYGRSTYRTFTAENKLATETVLVSSGYGIAGARSQLVNTYAYDNAGNLILRTLAYLQPEEQIERYDYNALNQMVTMYEHYRPSLGDIGNATKYYYDANGNVFNTRKYDNGNTIDPERDQVIEYEYNELDFLLRSTEYVVGDNSFNQAAGPNITELFGYDLAGNVTYHRTGDLTDVGELVGQNSQVGNPAGLVGLAFDYIVGQPQAQQDFYEYDEAGRLILSREAKAFNAEFHNTYDVFGHITQSWYVDTQNASSARRQEVFYEYNDAGDLVASNAGDGLWRHYLVDRLGRAVVTELFGTRLAIDDPVTYPPQITYAVYVNAEGSNYTLTFSQSSDFADLQRYDYKGRLILAQRRQWNPGSSNFTTLSTREYLYNELGNLYAEWDELSAFTSHEYDLVGNRVKTTLPVGNAQVWTYTRNALKSTYFVDASGNEVVGSRETYTLDSWDRRVRQSGKVTIDFRYDSRGRVIQTQGIATGSRYIYDAYDHRIGEINLNNKVFVSRYDNGYLEASLSFAGATQVVSRTASETGVPTFTDIAPALALLRVAETGQYASLPSYVLVAQYATNFLGQQVSVNRSGTWEDIGFDDFSRVLETSTGSFDYNRLGQLQRERTKINGVLYLYKEYTYDVAGRLQAAIERSSGVVTTYQYDNNTGKVRQEVQLLAGVAIKTTNVVYYSDGAISSWTYIVRGAGGSYSTVAAQNYTYDGNGRLTSDNTASYTYDGANRVASVGTALYTYNSQGLLYQIIHGLTTTYTYNLQGLISRIQGSSNRWDYTYDQVGNLKDETFYLNSTRYKAITHSYDSSYREIESVTYDYSNSANPTESYTYTYYKLKTGDITKLEQNVVVDANNSQSTTFNYSRSDPSLLKISGVSTGTQNGSATSYIVDQTWVYLDTSGNTIKKESRSSDGATVLETEVFGYNINGKINFKSDAANTHDYVYINDKPYAAVLFDLAGAYLSVDYKSYNPLTYPDPQQQPNVDTQPLEGGLQSHTVQEGDSLRSLAAQYYGSADLWYVIANANGLPDMSLPKAGARLSVPAKASNVYLDSQTVSLYKPGEIIGSSLPDVNAPEPPAVDADAECKQVTAIILVVVIAVAGIALSIVTAGALSGAAAAGTIGAASALGLGALAGVATAAASSLLTQVVLVELGVQEDYDWVTFGTDVGAGLLDGLSGGLSGVFKAAYIARKVAKIAKTTSDVSKLVKFGKKIQKAAFVVGQVGLELATEAASQLIQGGGKLKAEDAWLFAVVGASGGLGAVGDLKDIVGKAKRAGASAADLKGFREAGIDAAVAKAQKSAAVLDQKAGKTLQIGDRLDPVERELADTKFLKGSLEDKLNAGPAKQVAQYKLNLEQRADPNFLRRSLQRFGGVTSEKNGFTKIRLDKKGVLEETVVRDSTLIKDIKVLEKSSVRGAFGNNLFSSSKQYKSYDIVAVDPINDVGSTRSRGKAITSEAEARSVSQLGRLNPLAIKIVESKSFAGNALAKVRQKVADFKMPDISFSNFVASAKESIQGGRQKFDASAISKFSDWVTIRKGGGTIDTLARIAKRAESAAELKKFGNVSNKGYALASLAVGMFYTSFEREDGTTSTRSDFRKGAVAKLARPLLPVVSPLGKALKLDVAFNIDLDTPIEPPKPMIVRVIEEVLEIAKVDTSKTLGRPLAVETVQTTLDELYG